MISMILRPSCLIARSCCSFSTNSMLYVTPSASSRLLSSSAVRFQSQSAKNDPLAASPVASAAAPTPGSASAEASLPQNAYRPNNLERRFLVWTKKYKTIDQVPSFVSREEMEKCRSTMRIRISNIMILLTLVGCGVMVYSGKKAAERGETLTKINIDWHNKYNEDAKKAEEDAKNKK